MKKVFLLFILATKLFYSQNVGIDTSTPIRTLDINGDLKIKTTNLVTGNTNYTKIVSANKNTGEVDYLGVSSINTLDDKNNADVKRSLYLAAAPVTANECQCGDFTFRLNNTGFAEFRLNSNTVFLTNNNISNFKLGYGVKRWTGNSYNYVNRSVDFTSSDYLTYRSLDDLSFPTTDDASGNTIRIYTIVPPKQNKLYKVTILRNKNSNNNVYLYGIVCERFFMQSITQP